MSTSPVFAFDFDSSLISFPSFSASDVTTADLGLDGDYDTMSQFITYPNSPIKKESTPHLQSSPTSSHATKHVSHETAPPPPAAALRSLTHPAPFPAPEPSTHIKAHAAHDMARLLAHPLTPGDQYPPRYSHQPHSVVGYTPQYAYHPYYPYPYAYNTPYGPSGAHLSNGDGGGPNPTPPGTSHSIASVTPSSYLASPFLPGDTALPSPLPILDRSSHQPYTYAYYPTQGTNSLGLIEGWPLGDVAVPSQVGPVRRSTRSVRGAIGRGARAGTGGAAASRPRRAATASNFQDNTSAEPTTSRNNAVTDEPTDLKPTVIPLDGEEDAEGESVTLDRPESELADTISSFGLLEGSSKSQQEKRRRQELRAKHLALDQVLPPVGGRKATKNDILGRATSFIVEAKRNIRELQDENRQLRQRLDNAETRNAKLTDYMYRQSLPPLSFAMKPEEDFGTAPHREGVNE